MARMWDGVPKSSDEPVPDEVRPPALKPSITATWNIPYGVLGNSIVVTRSDSGIVIRSGGNQIRLPAAQMYEFVGVIEAAASFDVGQ